ncbi:MFS transporter [Pseudalkalibacillus salsuginis]|uniref:MFS transporter n=1 Tax=Pseudalkalibacillus salsuginis TaxID=2910972 RepID=UPI001F3BC19F|nr:MFS transporter [Pseudalkalibacillus salsuginis]MCF6410295.1 MFS transporter [Pseudalkalibacillus salsuginis]
MHNASIYLLAIGTFITGTSELIVAGIVDMIARDLQITIALAGQLVTAFSLAFAIGTPVVVTMTSRLERKKVLLGALAVFVVANVIAVLSPNFTILMFARILHGVSFGVFCVISFSVASKLVLPEKMGSAVSTIAMGVSTSLVIGVPFGVVVSEWFGWKTVFSLLAALTILLLIVLARMIPSLPGDEPITIKQQLSVLKNPKIVGGLFIFFFLISGYGSSYTYVTPFLKETVHIDTAIVSMTLFILGIFAMIGTHLSGYGADKWGAIKIIIFGLLVHILALLLLPSLATSVTIALLVMAIWVGATNLTFPALQTYFIQQAPKSSDLAISVSSSVAQLGLALGAGMGGIMVNSTGSVYYNPWLSSIIVIFALITAWITFSIKVKQVFEKS